MTVLPIIERELRMRARSRAAYATRLGAAAVGVLICMVPLMMSSRPFGTPVGLGQGLLNAVVVAGFLVSCAACLLTADVISSERREGTLGLLLLTRVRTFDVLVGKLGSAGLTSLCALLACLPMLMVPVLAGGVTGGEAFRKGLELPDALFLALAAGLWASAGGREWLKTGRNAFFMVAALALAPLLAGWLLGPGTPGRLIALLSPISAFSAAGAAAYAASGTDYWISLLLAQAAGWVLLMLAGFRLRKAWLEEAGTAVAPVQKRADSHPGEPDGPWLSCSWAPAVPEPAEGREENRKRRRSRALEDGADPILWLLQRQRGIRAILWAGALLSVANSVVLPLVVYRFVRPSSYWTSVMPLNLAEGLTVGALFAWAASRFFVEARRTGELELLLTTPAGAGQLVSTQWRVLRRLLRLPMLVMLVPSVLPLASIIAMNGRWPGPSPSSFLLQVMLAELLGCANIFFSVGALCWLGLWFGLRAGGQTRAVVWTVAVGTGLPWLVGIVWRVLLSALGGWSGSWNAPFLFVVLRWLPQVLELLLYIGLILIARHRLLNVSAASEATGRGLRQSVAAAVRDTVSAFRKVRHWTPS